MNEAADKIAQHYGSSARAERILAALAESGVPVESLKPEALYPFDQLHARQLEGTKEHLGRLRLKASDHLLDVGCGIGGPARYAAATFGCRVTGIDLTEAFVDAARDLTTRCGLGDRADFHHGDALAMPFADASFDAASCHYVGMNIADKTGVIREIFRVLKPGGKLAWSEVTVGSGQPPAFPLPWARDQAASFLTTADGLRAAFDASPFKVVEWIDETEALRAFAAQARAAGRSNTTVSAGNAVVLGDDFAERFRNFGHGIGDGRLQSIAVLAQALTDAAARSAPDIAT